MTSRHTTMHGISLLVLSLLMFSLQDIAIK
jgi:hypothetical protein